MSVRYDFNEIGPFKVHEVLVLLNSSQQQIQAQAFCYHIPLPQGPEILSKPKKTTIYKKNPI
jgi:hypothetical protein